MTNRLRTALPSDLRSEVEAVLDDWSENGNVARLWDGDASLWTGGDESRWLGWLHVAGEQLRHTDELRALAESARADGLDQALLVGMGGSSLAPEVLAETFGSANGAPSLRVLDSTDPAEVRAAEAATRPRAHAVLRVEQVGDDARAGRAEEILLCEGPRRCRARAGRQPVRGDHRPGFEPRARGSRRRLSRRPARARVHRRPLLGAVELRHGARRRRGVDVAEMLQRAHRMAEACRPGVAPQENPGLLLGAVLGASGLAGRDKLTLVTSPAIADLGAWLEQLVAESTGKDGRGLIPVHSEPLGEPDAYGEDRLFAYVAPRPRIPIPSRSPRWRRSSRPGTRSCASRSRTASSSGPSSSCGSSPRRSPARCSA